MSKGPWVRFFPSDWLAGTRGMTAAETGIYITLIAMMYERGAPIQNDHARLARLCGTTPAAMKSTLSILIDEGKLIIIDGGLWNNRVGVETEIRSEKTTQARKSAKTRWQKDKQNQPQGDADALQAQCGGNANQKPEARDQKEESDPNGSVVNAAVVDLPEKIPISRAFENYNIAAVDLGLPVARTLTPDRRRRLQARLREHGLDAWDSALLEIEQSDFLRGRNDKGWRASLDFLLQPASFTKVVEGYYRNSMEAIS